MATKAELISTLSENVPEHSENAGAVGYCIDSPSCAVAFHTLGCRTNQLESTAMAADFRTRGWRLVPFDEAADIYVINTCTVTARSDQESKRLIRRARLSNPQGRVVLTGCYAQMAPQEAASLEGVHFVIGNNFKDQLAELVTESVRPDRLSENLQPMVKVTEIDKSRIMTGASASGMDDARERTRGSMKIQDGCDFKCTYCIIWQARGPSRSLPIADLQAQLAAIANTGEPGHDGFREVVLTGINIGQYRDGDHDLGDLLKALVEVPGDFRLRLSSLDPMEVDQSLIDVVADSEGRICPYFHLSAQSAEDTVLKRMGRRHHVADFRKVCDMIMDKLPDAAIGADIIVGFPGETQARFNETLAVLEASPLNDFHVFSYSRRAGTPATDFEEQVPEPEKKRRAAILRRLAETKHLAYRKRFLGRTLDVIVEEALHSDRLNADRSLDDNQSRKGADVDVLPGFLTGDASDDGRIGGRGTSENFLRVTLKSDHLLQGNERVSARVISVTPDETRAQLIG